MKRFSIRNIRSPKEIKPRLFDYLIDDDGEEYFEVKIKKSYERILAKDVWIQISKESKQHN